MRGATEVILQHHQIMRFSRKWLSWLMGVTHETSFTMRGSTGLTLRATEAILQHHQILRLPWNRPKSDRSLLKTAAMSFTMCGPSENDPSMIREWTEHEPISPQPPAQPRLLFALRASILYGRIQHFALRLSFQISPSTVLPLPRKVAVELYQMLRLPRKVTLERQQIVRVPQKVTLLLLDSTITWLYCCLTLLLLASTVAWLYYSLTLLLLDLLFDSTATLLCDVVRISEVSQPKLPLLIISTYKIISIINNPDVWRYLLLFERNLWTRIWLNHPHAWHTAPQNGSFFKLFLVGTFIINWKDLLEAKLSCVWPQAFWYHVFQPHSIKDFPCRPYYHHYWPEPRARSTADTSAARWEPDTCRL